MLFFINNRNSLRLYAFFLLTAHMLICLNYEDLTIYFSFTREIVQYFWSEILPVYYLNNVTGALCYLYLH